MPSKESIRKNIKQVQTFHKKLINELAKIEQESRELMISQNYAEKIAKNSPWFIDDPSKSPKKKAIEKVEPKFDYQIKIKKIAKDIIKTPEQKEIILNTFLKDISEISDTDRSILLENFKGMPNKDLENELLNLCLIFCK